MNEPQKCLVLGPQRPEVYFGSAMRDHGLDTGPVAVISAGWQEAEGDIDILRPQTSHPMIDSGIDSLSSQLLAAEPAMHRAYRERQERLTELQALYRQRLRQHSIAVRRTLQAEGNPAVIAPERRHAVSQLRALDRHHQRQIDKAHLRFDSEFNVGTNPRLAEFTHAIHEMFARVDTVIITGGNLLVLLNRLRLFGLGEVLHRKHIVAWSAGAMLLGDRIVLFHERMPQGLRDAEIIDRGFGFLPKVIVMPDAKNRLRTGQELRMSALSRRFAPSACCLLDNKSLALFSDGQLVDTVSTRYPTLNGRLKPMLAS